MKYTTIKLHRNKFTLRTCRASIHEEYGQLGFISGHDYNKSLTKAPINKSHTDKSPT